MGMFTHIHVEEDVELPHWPEQLDKTEMGWQSKDFNRMLNHYKLTADGRLLKKMQSYREKTDKEKQDEAEKWDFDSWEEYVAAYDNQEMFPDFVQELDDTTEYPPLYPSDEVLDGECWNDVKKHGSFTFYSSLRPLDCAIDTFVAYEARFTYGDLDEIVVVGRHDDEPEDIIEELEEFDNE